MTPDYNALEKCARAATQGEREVGTHYEKGIISYFIYIRETGLKLFRVFARGYHEKEAEDAEFTAAANPTAILELIAHARLQEERIGRLRNSNALNKCTCKYKPFTHQYFFECDRCKALAADDELAKGVGG